MQQTTGIFRQSQPDDQAGQHEKGEEGGEDHAAAQFQRVLPRVDDFPGPQEQTGPEGCQHQSQAEIPKGCFGEHENHLAQGYVQGGFDLPSFVGNYAVFVSQWPSMLMPLPSPPELREAPKG